MDSMGETDSLEKLRLMIREADERRLSNASFSDFRIWHAMCRGRLQTIFGANTKNLDAWDSLAASFAPEDIDDELFLYEEIDSAPLDAFNRDTGYLDNREVVIRSELHARTVEARRILLDYITLVSSGFVGEVVPAMLPERLDLGFIDNPNLKRLCNDLYRQAVVCVRTQCYEASAVLMGSLLEGILYSVAEQRRDEVMKAKAAQRNHKNQTIVDSPEKWELEKLIAGATELGWITKDTSVLGGLLRQHRNYIHPAKHIKDATNIDKETARLYVTVVESCIRDINNWLKQSQNIE